MKTIRLQLENREGLKLSARLEMPADGRPSAYAIFAHCFTCNKNLKAISNISRALTTHDIAVLRFDFTGLGQSEGDFADSNFTSNVNDLVDVARYLETHYRAPALLVGHSLGGAAVLLAAGQIPSVKAVATIGAPADPHHVTHLLSEDLDTIKKHGKAVVTLAGRSFTIKDQFLHDLEERNMQEHIKGLKRALLIMHSPQDTTVGVDNAADIYTSAMHPKSFISLDGADHLLSKEADSLYAGSTIATFASRYIELKEDDPLETSYQTVARNNEDFLCEVKTGNHFLVADEPKHVDGGQDLGPSPYDFLTSALATCTAMTLRMYARHKKWDLTEVEVHVTHEKRHADDCQGENEPSGTIDHLDRDLVIEGNLDEKQRERLLQIADKCPVHRTLEGQVVINTRVVNP